MKGLGVGKVVAVAVVVAVAAGAAVGVYFAVGGSSKDNSAKDARGAGKTVTGHQFLKPECTPVEGPRWRFPGPARIASTSYELFAIHYDCATAGTWTKRLARLTIPVHRSGQYSRVQGPPGFYCTALPDASGHAYVGGCQKGNAAFGWNWNVANSRSALVRDETGKYHVERLAGSDAQTIIRPLAKGRYQVYVLNTSGIGFLDGFTWSPPPGWTITKVTKTTGGNCRLQPDGNVACRGRVPPPSCLCAGDGGAVTIDLAVRAPAASKGRTFGAVGAKLRITNMTPVPYLVPGTPAAAKRQRGV